MASKQGASKSLRQRMELIFSILVPGLGHFMSGHRRLAIGFLAIWFLALFAFTHLSLRGAIWADVGSVLILALWAAIAWHARRCIHRSDGGIVHMRKAYQAIFTVSWIVLYSLIRLQSPAKLYKFPASSMNPTIRNGDRIVANLAAYDDAKPGLGDLIVFKYPKDPHFTYIKRVIGIPGDRISISEKKVIRNGQLISMVNTTVPDFASGEGLGRSFQFRAERLGEKSYVTLIDMNAHEFDHYAEVIVPECCYFVLGDNRDYSNDSRFFGFVPKDHIIGRAEYVYLSIYPEEFKVRWHRLGMKLE